MQKRNSIVNMPLVGGVVLSIAVHAAAVYSRGLYTPVEPKMESGKTVVQLTLIPSGASQAHPPEPTPPNPAEEQKIEPEPVLPIPDKSVPTPFPAPAIATQPEPAVKPIPNPEPESPKTPEPEPQPLKEVAAVNSVELNSSLLEDKGVTTEAVANTAIQPQYPRISQRRNETGDVVLLVQVLASGNPGNVRIEASSGHKRLDEAALKAVQKATFNPARISGRAIDSETEITISFKLTNE